MCFRVLGIESTAVKKPTVKTGTSTKNQYPSTKQRTITMGVNEITALVGTTISDVRGVVKPDVSCPIRFIS